MTRCAAVRVGSCTTPPAHTHLQRGLIGALHLHDSGSCGPLARPLAKLLLHQGAPYLRSQIGSRTDSNPKAPTQPLSVSQRL